MESLENLGICRFLVLELILFLSKNLKDFLKCLRNLRKYWIKWYDIWFKWKLEVDIFFSRFWIRKQTHFDFMEPFYVSSQIAFSLNVKSQNKHREDIFSLHEPFECVFFKFFSWFWIKKQIHFDFMDSFYMSSQIVFSKFVITK